MREALWHEGWGVSSPGVVIAGPLGRHGRGGAAAAAARKAQPHGEPQAAEGREAVVQDRDLALHRQSGADGAEKMIIIPFSFYVFYFITLLLLLLRLLLLMLLLLMRWAAAAWAGGAAP